MNATARSLHSDDRASLSILMLLTVFVWVALIGMVWNVGEYSYRKQIAQDAADSAAYAAAEWMSRGLNAVTGTNMAMVRNASAMAIAEANVLAMASVDSTLAEKSALAAVPIVGELYLAEVALAAIQSAQVAILAIEAAAKLPPRQNALSRYQKAIVDDIPRAIERQRNAQQLFSRHLITLVKPGEQPRGSTGVGGSSIALPVKRDRSLIPVQFSLVTQRRVQRDAKNWEGDYKKFVFGEGEKWWKVSVPIAVETAMLYPRRDHHVLATSGGGFSPFEVDANRLFSDEPFTLRQRLQHFSVIAVARSTPLAPPKPVLRQYFRKPEGPAAFAQAETFNGLNANPIVRFRFIAQPWRVWTKPGWNWRPRLAQSDGIEEALINYPSLRTTLFGLTGRSPSSPDAYQPIALH